MDLLWDGRSLVGRRRGHPRPGVPVGTRRGDDRAPFPPGFAPRCSGSPPTSSPINAIPLDAVWPAARVRRITDLLAASAAPGRVLEEIAIDHRPEPDDDAALIDEVAVLAGSGWASAAIAARGRAQRAPAPAPQRRRVRVRDQDAPADPPPAARARARPRPAPAPRTRPRAVGYADQAHLARDVKDLAGVPLTAAHASRSGSGANSSTWLPSGSSTTA